MSSLRDAFPDLKALYAKLPPVPCIACGLCCVSPHITLVEFVYMMDGVLKDWSKEAIIRLVADDQEAEKRYPGNHKCAYQSEKGLCSVHQGRSLICRLEGLPVLDRLGMRESHICPYITDEQLEVPVSESDIDTWVQEAFDLTNRYYPTYEEPYWLSSLTPECWFAVALDPDINQDLLLMIRSLIREAIDLDFLEPHYVNHTGLAEKLENIDAFFRFAEDKQPRRAVQAIRRVLYDYPRTGTYYLNEGKKYFHLMRDIVREQRKK